MTESLPVTTETTSTTTTEDTTTTTMETVTSTNALVVEEDGTEGFLSSNLMVIIAAPIAIALFYKYIFPKKNFQT